ncbi:MAG: alpha-2-macroglobulin [Magnetococcales bacterium]|nr:alpha-2-macroglobulin [Magnetococcales bacterium]
MTESVQSVKRRAYWWPGLLLGLLMASLLVLTTAPVGVQAASGGEGGVSVVPKPESLEARQVVIIPDRLLRRWDPVTIFFKRPLGPEKSGPEDHPARFATVTPSHPGAFRWLNRHTLQFRPAEPWPPLTRFHWQTPHGDAHPTTLIAPPTATIPAHGAKDLPPVSALTLTFPEPLDPVLLARMITLELRPLPGIDAKGGQHLGSDSFSVKALERRSRSDKASYELHLHRPIDAGTLAIVRLRLSLEKDQAEMALKEIRFSTAPSHFYVTRLGCANQKNPVTPKGVHYPRSRPLQCGRANRAVEVQFSAPPRALGPIEARRLVAFSPAVENLTFSQGDNLLTIRGDFLPDRLYQVDLHPTELKDVLGRGLSMQGSSRLFLHFPGAPDRIQWREEQGIMERYGPQQAPLEGRGLSRIDLRIHPVNPLSRDFWPFPQQPVLVDESSPPPGPGEEPASHNNPEKNISAVGIKKQIQALGSPVISQMIDLPLKKGGSGAQFGLDLKPHLEKISGHGMPGSYLVGVRRLDQGSTRSWMRVQVTDLALTTVEEVDGVGFIVTSLASGQPVRGAEIRLEGSVKKRGGKPQWQVLAKGRTDAKGRFQWRALGWKQNDWRHLRRMVVSKGGDHLVLDPGRPPERYADNHWQRDGNNWLQWAYQKLDRRRPNIKQLCHLFTERPLYKPADAVHIKGYLRRYHKGVYTVFAPKSAHLEVTGPGNRSWRYPLKMSGRGSFYHRFQEKRPATGSYRARIRLKGGHCGSVSFKLENYRLPRFETLLSGPSRAPLDRPFTIQLAGRYYAGGQVANRPLRWRVTQFPYHWKPTLNPDYFYSTDARFSGEQPFESQPIQHQQGHTDDKGAASIMLDPSREPTAQPRRYIVESTVIGADDQTVTATHETLSLPPFVLGLKVPRYLPNSQPAQDRTESQSTDVQEIQGKSNTRRIDGRFVVSGSEGEPLAGQPLTLRLLERRWHSILSAGDFSQGEAKYRTEVVEEPIHEQSFTSTERPQSFSLPVTRAGVYVVELEGRDRLGRMQRVRVDLFVDGGEAVAWSRPPTKVFKVTPERPKYAPGEMATLVLESPFQEARALAVVEDEGGINRYEWMDVRGGSATYQVKISARHLPRLPVHFLLMRGRVGRSRSGGDLGPDLGKPVTVAATAWIPVDPVAHKVEIALEHPTKALPGQDLEVKIRLQDEQGSPLQGEVTLWLVDQAVLSLAREARLDPLPDFIVPRRSRISVHDTRNLAFGDLPFQEIPGGGVGAKRAMSLLDRTSVRRQFSAVPFYASSIMIGPKGETTIKVKLSDNLTTFKVRAKAVSGVSRFGFAVGRIDVRLPVIVQPTLPRFVRPGDQFTASAIGRLVEGRDGDGRAEIKTQGLEIIGKHERSFQWRKGAPERIQFQLRVPTPSVNGSEERAQPSVSVTVGVEHPAELARDAFSVKLPIRPDRRPEVIQSLEHLRPEGPLKWPIVKDDFRSGSFKRTILLSSEPSVLRMAGALNQLKRYPHGCTEQRISQSRALLAERAFLQALKWSSEKSDHQAVIQRTLDHLPLTLDEEGLLAFWPGGEGRLILSAWALQFMVEARDAGYGLDLAFFERLVQTLRGALRSDHPYHGDGIRWSERVWAITALVQAGEAPKSYMAELARNHPYLDLESTAQVIRVLAKQGYAEAGEPAIKKLYGQLWSGIKWQLHEGQERYAGLSQAALSDDEMVLPSESRALAQVIRALQAMPRGDPRSRLLVDSLVALGRGDGWGSVNADAEAFLALAAFMKKNGLEGPPQQVEMTQGSARQKVYLGGDNAMVYRMVSLENVPVGLALVSPKGQGDMGRPLALHHKLHYLPKRSGALVEARVAGFVVQREMRVISEDGSADRIKLEKPGVEVALQVGDVVEEHLQLVNTEARHHVAVEIPFAAGVEPLNPALKSALPEAVPSGSLTHPPTYRLFGDDRVVYYYDYLPQGTHHFYLRLRATIPGEFIQPPARAEMMYRPAVQGRSVGARVVVKPAPSP